MISAIELIRDNPWIVPLAISHRLIRGLGLDNATRVMEDEWDNLIVLDACRYDLFDSSWEGPGHLRSVTSLGSNTTEWMTRNFVEPYPDTVYVTANPQLQANDIAQYFHDTIDVWDTHWDGELNTVLPKDMADATIRAIDEYSDKRVISHWIQPHYPFIGETGRQFDHGFVTGNGITGDHDDGTDVWHQIKVGNVDEEKVKQAYRENLELATPEVKRVIESVKGKTVVTSDHGNAFGDFGLYGHPGNKFIEGLVKVPWLVVDGERRSTVDGGLEVSDMYEEEMEERLSDLGYRQ